MPGHGVKQSAKNVRNYIRRQASDTIHRFDAEPELKEIFRKHRKGDQLVDKVIDRASFKNTRLANDFIKKSGVDAKDVAEWRRRTRNNELAKSIALYAAPIAVAGAGLATYKKIKGRKDEDKMDKMSAEKYAEFVQKLAEEITEEVANEEMEVTASEAAEGIDVDAIAERALQAYESAQMRKEAAENDYVEACAYEDAAMIILNNEDVGV